MNGNKSCSDVRNARLGNKILLKLEDFLSRLPSFSLAPSFRIILSFLPLPPRSFPSSRLALKELTFNTRIWKLARWEEFAIAPPVSSLNVRLACFILPGLRSTLSFVLSSRPSLISGYSPLLSAIFQPPAPSSSIPKRCFKPARAVWLVETFEWICFYPSVVFPDDHHHDESSALNSRRHVTVDSRDSLSLSLSLSRRARRTMYGDGSRLRTIRCIGVSVNFSLAAKRN